MTREANDNLIEQVREAWRNAAEQNAYDFSEHSAQDVALDMLAYDADLEDCTLEELTAAVRIVTGKA